MAAVTYQLLHGTMPLHPIYSAPDDFRVIDMVEDEYDPPTILGRPFLNTIKAIIYIGTGEVHIYFPSEMLGWADYEGEVIRSEDIQLEQNCPKETIALSQVWKEKIVIDEEEAPPESPTTPPSES